MGAALETSPVAPTSKLEIRLPRKGTGKSCDEITSRGFLLICGMPGHLIYMYPASKGMQTADQCSIALLGKEYHQQ